MEKQEIGHQLERLPFMTASEFNLACDALLSRSQHMASHSSIIMTSVKGTVRYFAKLVSDTFYLPLIKDHVPLRMLGILAQVVRFGVTILQYNV